MSRILIIEDEPMIAQDLELTLSIAGFAVIGPYNSAPKDIQEITKQRPDLALLDINLNDTRDGIDIAMQFENKFPIIFVTSYYDEPTLKRVENVNPHAYILKPYKEEEILMNVKLALSKNSQRNRDIKPERIQVKNGNKFIFVDVQDIAYLKAESNYTKVELKNGTNHLISQTLKVIHEKIECKDFCRVHKSFVVNTRLIEGISGGKILLLGNKISIGRTYKKVLTQFLGLD